MSAPISDGPPEPAQSVLDRWEAAGLLRRAGPRRPSAEIVAEPVSGDSTESISADREPWNSYPQVRAPHTPYRRVEPDPQTDGGPTTIELLDRDDRF